MPCSVALVSARSIARAGALTTALQVLLLSLRMCEIS